MQYLELWLTREAMCFIHVDVTGAHSSFPFPHRMGTSFFPLIGILLRIRQLERTISRIFLLRLECRERSNLPGPLRLTAKPLWSTLWSIPKPLPLCDVQAEVDQHDTDHRKDQPQRAIYQVLDQAPQNIRGIKR